MNCHSNKLAIKQVYFLPGGRNGGEGAPGNAGISVPFGGLTMLLSVAGPIGVFPSFAERSG